MNGFAPNFQELSESPRIIRPLDRLVLEVTVYCNLKCKMCSVWEVRENGVPLQLAKQLLEDAYRLGARSFVPYGAENFMRKDFVDMVEHAHAIGYELQPMVTNGTMISEENLERLSRCSSVRLSISIDGPRDVHDELRGAGNFDKSVATARECIRRGIGVIFTGVIMRETLEHLPSLIDLAGDVGIKEVSYQPFNTFISGPSKDTARFSLRSVERDAIAAALTKLGEYAHRRKILIYTEAMFELMPDYLAYGKQPIPRGGCKLPSTMLLVDWRGDVYPCFFMAEAPDRMGNVYRDRLDEIWHSRIHKQLQILALTERCPGCLANCSDVQTYTDNAHQLSISKT